LPHQSLRSGVDEIQQLFRILLLTRGFMPFLLISIIRKISLSKFCRYVIDAGSIVDHNIAVGPLETAVLSLFLIVPRLVQDPCLGRIQ